MRANDTHFSKSLFLFGGVVLLIFSFLLDWTLFLKWIGLVHELHRPRVHGDLAIVRAFSIAAAVVLMVLPIIVGRYPEAISRLGAGITRSLSGLSHSSSLPSFLLVSLILTKTLLQLGLHIGGYVVYSADDFGRIFRADQWLQNWNSDFGWQGWLSLGQPWLPFPDYLFGLALTLHRDLFFTPKVLNLLLSSISVIVAYLLGRELFDRAAELFAAAFWAFLPWHVWLGISGMTADLPSIVMSGLSGLFLLRWLKNGRPSALLTGASFLFLADGMRYENWLFSATFCCLVAYRTLFGWKQRSYSRPFFLSAGIAIVVASAFPILYMAASYLVLGSWLPAARHDASYVSASSPDLHKINLFLLALVSFPFELTLGVAGVLLFIYKAKDDFSRPYLIFLFGSLALFVAVFKGSLPPHGAGVSRVLLPYVLLLLPYVAYLLIRLLEGVETQRNLQTTAACLLVVTLLSFDIARPCNYRDTFPKEAIYAGWVSRWLQEMSVIPKDPRVLIETSKNHGHMGIMALSKKPELFVEMDDPMASTVSEGDSIRSFCVPVVEFRSFERPFLTTVHGSLGAITSLIGAGSLSGLIRLKTVGTSVLGSSLADGLSPRFSSSLFSIVA